jgi:hypothetical protein
MFIFKSRVKYFYNFNKILIIFNHSLTITYTLYNEQDYFPMTNSLWKATGRFKETQRTSLSSERHGRQASGGNLTRPAQSALTIPGGQRAAGVWRATKRSPLDRIEHRIFANEAATKVVGRRGTADPIQRAGWVTQENASSHKRSSISDRYSQALIALLHALIGTHFPANSTNWMKKRVECPHKNGTSRPA